MTVGAGRFAAFAASVALVGTIAIAPGAVAMPRDAGGAAASEPAASDPFFARPAALGTSRPGDVLRARELPAPRLGLLRLESLPARIWQVIYRSTAADGDPNAISGTVLVPTRPWAGAGKRPLVGYQIGTHGMADRCAPSRGIATGDDYELGLIRHALDRGWAVAVTDYEGLGTPGRHTYLVHRSEGRAVLDMVRAAQRLRTAGVSHAAPVVLWGYSQGGGATAAAAELAPRYAPKLRIRGAAPGSVPADLPALADHLDGSDSFGLLLAMIGGHATADPALRLRKFLTAEGRQLVAQVSDTCVPRMSRVGAGRRLSEFASLAHVSDDPALARALGRSRIGRVAPPMPVLMVHGDADTLIPISVGHRLRRQWCAQGAQVQFVTVPGAGHIQGALRSVGFVVDWIAARFAGTQAAPGCASSQVLRWGSDLPSSIGKG